MEESFAQAAFQLEPDKISQPVATHFGVHLILVTEVKPGEKKWTDVRDQLRAPVSQALFLALAQQERQRAKIEFMPGVPHFKLGTHDLATE